MRRALLCSAWVFLAATAAGAQPFLKRDDKPAAPAAPDTRPRLKRDDTPVPVVAEPAKPAVKHRAGTAAHKPAQPAVAGTRAAPRDTAACGQVRDFDAAIAGCTRLIDDAKQRPRARALAYFNRGNAHLAKGDRDKAIADFDETIKLDPKNASAYNNRGNAKSESGDAEGALSDFDAAIKLNARYAAAYLNRANAHAIKGDTDAALKGYDAAIRANRRNINAYIARGALLLASGESVKARIDLRLAAALDRRNPYALLWQDIAERRTKQKGVFAKLGTRGLDMKAWPAPVIRLATGETKADTVLAAADNANATVKQAHSCEANFYSGEYALIGGDRDDAVKLFKTAATECPHGFLEGIAAAAELKGMGEKVGSN